MRTLLLTAIFSLGLTATLIAQKQNVDVLIKSGNLIDVRTGNMLTKKIIATRGKTIVGVFDESQLKNFQAKTIVDATGKFIIPGLWDMHVHFGGGDTLIEENKNLFPLYIAHGITGIRDAAADLSTSVLKWRDQISRGELAGPTLFTSGPKLEGYKSTWIGDIEVSTPAEVDKMLDSLQGLKVDFVKITDNAIKPDIYLYILQEAKKRGMKTSGHVPFALTMDEVSSAGLGSVEHMSYVFKAGSTRDKEVANKVRTGQLTTRVASPMIAQSFDEATALAVYQRMAKNGTFVVPTLNISRTVAYLDQDNHQNDTYLQYIGQGLKNTYAWRVNRVAKDGPEAIAERHAVYEKSASLLPLLHKAGVTIMAGTDAGFLNSYVYPGLGLHHELGYFVKAGLTPLQALQSAIIPGPLFLGKTALFGDIAPGKSADIVLLDRNPIQDITATQAIHTVILRGTVYNRKALDGLLAEAKKKARK
ncbi:amidohydrolase family protein [Spirosoma sp. KCTC 42546]|uniref:amidohydrolase family protein n=1 Tax=Spirosoma sp. KCTC 42546 TaxID=2520506 RepID=UPI00115881B8|nr:amidohydrolase family protein [Spirosoma sp. KCTC 42546]QDK79753.1 amidohydrolase family protein [Spirosoma sp. KCTC 42546]